MSKKMWPKATQLNPIYLSPFRMYSLEEVILSACNKGSSSNLRYKRYTVNDYSFLGI